MIYGSICLSNVPKEQFKKVMCKDGVERVFLNMKIVRRKEVSKFGHTHFASCEPANKDERVQGVNYIFGDFKEYVPDDTTSPENIAQAPVASDDDLPFSFRGVTA